MKASKMVSRGFTDDRAFEPDVFEVSFVGLPGFGETTIAWDGSTLVYSSDDGKMELHPPEEVWKDLWSTLDRLDAWSWRRDYTNLHVLDGGSWSLSIVYGDRELSCRGLNAYPERFEELMRSLRGLIGR